MSCHTLKTCFALSCAVCALLAVASPAQCEPSDRSVITASTFILTEENDAFAKADGHYTQGLKFTWVSGDLEGYAQDQRLPRFVVPYLQILPFVNEPGQQYNVALSLGQSIFTPGDTSISAPQPQDRPYAGWTYISLALHAKTSMQLDTFETTLGMVGPSSHAGETQNDFHELIGNKPAKGWKNQIHDEPGIMLTWQRTLRSARAELGGNIAWDFLPHFGITAGNVLTQASAGFETRLGYKLPWDFGTSLIRPGGGVSAPAEGSDPRLESGTAFGLHFFVGAEGRAVARNIFLDGNTWEHSASVTKKNFVADLSGGIGLVLGPAKLTYTQVYRTEEFDGQKEPQLFGSISLSVTF